MKTHAFKTITTALLATVMLGGCATYTGQSNDPNDPNRTRNNALIGAGIGAVAGLLSGGDATERRQRALVGVGLLGAKPAAYWPVSASKPLGRSMASSVAGLRCSCCNS